jgi:hypothetical protein
MRIAFSLSLVFLFFFAGKLHADEGKTLEERYKQLPEFKVPDFYSDPEFLPLVYLKRMKIEDTGKKLSKIEKDAISKLFIETSRAVKKKHHQDYPLETKTPIYQLLKANFPDIAKKEGEKGTVIFLADIADHLMKHPGSTPD